MISAFLSCLLVASTMSSSDALVVVLNSRNASDVRTFSEAKAIVERDAAAGGALQQFVIGATTDDKTLARSYLDASRDKIRTMAERKDNSLAWYLLSLEKNDFACLRKAAAGGNVQALNALGTISTQEALRQEDLPPDARAKILTKSFEYFRKAAARKDPNGYINLGTCYLRGFGCKEDMELAFFCFKAAAEAGHPEGMDNVSACYQFGHGVKMDAERSLYWKMRGRVARGDKAAEKWLEDRK